MGETQYLMFSVIVGSNGPNGLDEGGLGDDLRLYGKEDVMLVAYRHSRLLPGGVLGGLALAWIFVWSWRRRPVASIRVEVVRATVASLLPGFGLATLVLLAGWARWYEEQEPFLGMVVQPTVAVVGTICLVTFLALLWLRMRLSPTFDESVPRDVGPDCGTGHCA